MAREPILSVDAVRRLIDRGFTQTAVARTYGVTPQAVSDTMARYGIAMPTTPRDRILRDHFPFKVPTKQQLNLYKRLRDWGGFVATNGDDMNPNDVARLRTFIRNLKDNDLVIEFDPDIPPMDKVSARGGWAYRQREATDGDLMIRVNKYTDLTAEARDIWSMPNEKLWAVLFPSEAEP